MGLTDDRNKGGVVWLSVKEKSNCSFTSSSFISFWSMSKPLFCQFRDCAGNVPVVGDGKICVIFRIKLKDIYKESDRRRREMNKSRTF